MITAQITSIKKKISHLGGFYYHVFFKGENGRDYFTYIYPKMMNFKRWKKVLKEGIVLSDFKLLKGRKNLINADSNFKIVKE